MLYTSTSHEEGVVRKWGINTKGFRGNSRGEVTAIYGNEIRKNEFGKFEEIPGTDFEWPADLVFIAMGYKHPIHEGLIESLRGEGLELDSLGNVKAPFRYREGDFRTGADGVFACGDVRRGQSLIVWAISEGRKCAVEVDRFLSRKR
jgi:glutamate synthase (NADPH/NADH) small chain